MIKESFEDVICYKDEIVGTTYEIRLNIEDFSKRFNFPIKSLDTKTNKRPLRSIKLSVSINVKGKVVFDDDFLTVEGKTEIFDGKVKLDNLIHPDEDIIINIYNNLTKKQITKLTSSPKNEFHFNYLPHDIAEPYSLANENRDEIIRMTLSNEESIVFPSIFASDAITKDKYSLFVVKRNNEQNSGIMIAATMDQHIAVLFGFYDVLVTVLKCKFSSLWVNEKIETSDGIFERLIAPSHQELMLEIGFMRAMLS